MRKIPLGLLVSCAAYVAAWPPAGFSNSTIDNVRARLLEIAQASWELGTAAEALLELSWPSLSVFSSKAFPPPTNLTDNDNAFDVLAIANRTMSMRAPTEMALLADPAVGDPASIGVAVLLANWTRLNSSEDLYGFAASQQLRFLLEFAPRTRSGAISHRTDQVQLWSDFVYMAPPFIAYFGALQGGDVELDLLMVAYDQCRLYRDALQDPGSGLWRHVVFGSWQDNSHWATGNAWAAAGMLRVLQTLRYSKQASKFIQQQADLTSWIQEIVDGSMTYQQPNGALLNVIDDPTSFADTSSTALMGAVAFRMLTLFNTTSHTDPSDIPSRMLNFANQTLIHVGSNIDSEGWLQNTVDPYTFNNPSDPGAHSPEGQAFVLLLQAAWRDWISSATARGLEGLSDGATNRPPSPTSQTQSPTHTHQPPPFVPQPPPSKPQPPPRNGRRSTGYCALRRK